MAVGASSGCVADASISWAVCGVVVARTTVPLYFALPDPVSATLSVATAPLTAPDDDAAASPLSVATSSALTLLVLYSDGSQRDLTTDSRTTFSFETAAGSFVCSSQAQGVLSVAAGARAAGCNVTVAVATVQLGNHVLVASVSVALTYLERLDLDFVGYPSNNAAVSLSSGGSTTLYALECMAGAYQHATARVLAYLTTTATTARAVTSQSVLTSSLAAVVIESSRVRPTSAGSAVVTATFGASSANATLQVSSSPMNLTSLSWSLPLTAGSTLAAEQAATTSTAISVTYTTISGATLSYVNIGSSAFSSWLDLSTMVSFSDGNSTAVTVDSSGTLALADNSISGVALTAAASCQPAVYYTVTVWANLLPKEMDVDLGEISGSQFVHTPGSAVLAVKVRVRPRYGYYLTSFQLKIGDLDSECSQIRTPSRPPSRQEVPPAAASDLVSEDRAFDSLLRQRRY